jgi:hypothetical protein
MRTFLCLRPLVALGLALTPLTGCQSTPPTRFYTLASVAVPVAEDAKAKRPPAVVIGVVSLPKYLDRPQLVTRPDAYVVELSEFDRWAEPLDDMVSRVVAENLGQLLGSDQVFIGTRSRGADRAYQVEIAFYRFDVDDANQARVVARWEIREREKDRLVATQQTTVGVPVTGAGYEAQTAALSAALAQLCREIAEPLRRLDR